MDASSDTKRIGIVKRRGHAAVARACLALWIGLGGGVAANADGPQKPDAGSTHPGQPVAKPDGGSAQNEKTVKLDVRRFRVIERDSGPESYYFWTKDDDEEILRARYRYPLKTVTLGMQLPDSLRQATKRLRWRWRVHAFPIHGNECRDGYADSAANVFVTFKRGLRYYVLKYSWSTDAPKGAVCDKRRNPLMARDTIILESGGEVNIWKEEEIDPRGEFVRYFGGSREDVPDFVGIGLMTDGDQTQSPSEADYGGFSVMR